VWRFFKLYEKLGIRPTLSINARVCEDYERVAAQARDAGWDSWAMSMTRCHHKLDDQRATIHRSMDILERFIGKRPKGWLGPGLTQTLDTPEYLAEAGVKYIGDWVWDDEPSEITTAKGPLVTLPYTVEHNDIPMMAVANHESPYWLQRFKDGLDRLHAEGEERAKIMAVAIHPYISGQPHRIKYLEEIYDYAASLGDVAFWNGEEILDWYTNRKTKA